MEINANLPGLTLGIVAILAVFVLIIFIFKQKRTLKIGDKITIGTDGESLEQYIDRQNAEFEAKIANHKAERLHDEILQRKLFRQSGIIDDAERADKRRVIRGINAQFNKLFAPYANCKMPLLNLTEQLKDILQEKVDYNHLRSELSGSSKNICINDILDKMQHAYDVFMMHIPNLPCNKEHYPAWCDIEKGVKAIVVSWTDDMISIMNNRIKEKIELYEDTLDKFNTEDMRNEACIYPLNKNKGYIRALNPDTYKLLL